MQVEFVNHFDRAFVNHDRVFVLEEGRIAEEGSPSKLMQAEGIYFHLMSKGDLK